MVSKKPKQARSTAVCERRLPPAHFGKQQRNTNMEIFFFHAWRYQRWEPSWCQHSIQSFNSVNWLLYMVE